MRLTFMRHYENVLYGLIILICMYVYVYTPHTNLTVSDDFFLIWKLFPTQITVYFL